MRSGWIPWRRGAAGRVPVMLQMSAVECGAACVAMVLSAYGRATSVRECREELGLGRDGANALQLVTLTRSRGMEVKALSLDLDALPSVTLPAIIHWGFLHYLVLERWDGEQATVVDPAVGRRVLSRGEFSRGFTGVALEMRPGPEFQTRPARNGQRAWRFARDLLAVSRGLLAGVALVSLFLQLLLLVPALATKFVIDTVLGFDQADLLPGLGVGVALLLVTHGLSTYSRGVLLNHLHARMDHGIMRRFFAHLFNLPYRYFQLRTSGDMVMRLSSNIVIREILTGQTLSVLIDGLFVVVYVVVLMTIAPIYGAVVLVLGVLQFLVIVITFRSMRDLTHRDIGAQAEAQSYAVEAVSGAETIKAAGAEDEVYDRWSYLFDRQLVASMRRRRLDVANDALMGALRLGAPLILLWLGAYQVLAGAMTIGSMLALNGLAAALLSPLAGLANSTRSLQTVGTHLDRIRDVLEEEVEQDRSRLVDSAHRSSGQVELCGVGFRYGGTGAWALREVDLTLAAGSKVALVGPTGSGKTTLAKMAIGLYPPDEGAVYVDGRPLSQLDLRELRRQCGVVTQDPAFFAGTIRENITFGRNDLPLDQVVEAARRAQIHDEIVAMPMGYATVLTEGGGGLSGGQRQRLALARALVGQPALVVLDEATSHLDVVTERRVDAMLSELACTRVVVAHRLSTVRNADLIVVLEDGRIVQRGTHEELIAAGGAYERLVRGQLQDGVGSSR